MLVTTMNKQEMLNEIMSDYKEILLERVRYSRAGNTKHLRTAKEFPVKLSHLYTSSTGNRYIITDTFLSKKDVFEHNPLSQYRAILHTDEGIELLATILSTRVNDITLFRFRPHVFKRYKERMGYKQDGIDLLKVFCNRNSDMIEQSGYIHKEGDIENDIMLTVHDGALFGTLDAENDGCVIVNTFIANDTMKNGYKSQFNNNHNASLNEAKRIWNGIIPSKFITDKKRK